MALAGQMFYTVGSTATGKELMRLARNLGRRVGFFESMPLPLRMLDFEAPLVREMMRLWSRIHWAGTDGMMPPEQLMALLKLCWECDAEGDTVELGAWVGLTTCYLAAACRAKDCGDVYAVDTFTGTMEGNTTYTAVEKYGGSTRQAFEDNIARAGVSDRVHACPGWTTEVASEFSNRKIRFLFIDADHSYEGVKADFEHWMPLVVPGGTIAFHDYLQDGVKQFVNGELRHCQEVDIHPGCVEENVFAVTKR